MHPTSTLRLSFVLALLTTGLVQAQDQGQNPSSTDPSSYATQCVSALQSAGFNGLADTLMKINDTQPGMELFSRLSSGKNFTVFAPDDTAVQQLQPEVTSNTTRLAEYISYHFVDGDLANSTSTSGGGGAGAGGASSSTMSSMSSSSTMTSSEGGASSTQSTNSEDGNSQTTTDTVTASQSAGALFGRRYALLPRQDSGNSSGGGNGSDSGSSGSGSNSSSGSNPQLLAGVWPDVTLGRTLLNSNASSLVKLEGDKSQVLAWTRSTPEGNVTILNQARNITVDNGTTWNNLFIKGINGTLIPPGNLSTALTAINATTLASVLSNVQVAATNGTNETALQSLESVQGLTLFIPDNAAYTNQANDTLQTLQGNTTALQAVIQNHYINGTTLYSTELDNSTTATTAAGENLQFSTNDTGTYVSGPNNTMAKIIRPDVLLENGVAHIIDNAFIATQSNPSQAAAAFASASSSEAAHSTTETGPIGGIGAGGGSQSTQAPESQSQSMDSSSMESSSTQSSSSDSSSQASSTVTQTETTETGGGGSDTGSTPTSTPS